MIRDRVLSDKNLRTPAGVDTVIRSAIFDSFGVSQGGELTQEYTLHLFANMHPAHAAAIAKRLGSSVFELTYSIAGRTGGFAESPLHGITSGTVGDLTASGRAMQMLHRAIESEPVTQQAVYQRALYVGRRMAGRDARFLLGYGDRRKASEPPEYGLYTANHNSHLLHYAYIEDAGAIPARTLPSSARYAAVTLTSAVEAGDAAALIETNAAQPLIRNLRAVTTHHLEHYPEHTPLIDEGYMEHVRGDALLNQLPELPLQAQDPEPCGLPR